jgi:hypothetical protein
MIRTSMCLLRAPVLMHDPVYPPPSGSHTIVVFSDKEEADLTSNRFDSETSSSRNGLTVP